MTRPLFSILYERYSKDVIIVLDILAETNCSLPGFDKVYACNVNFHPNLHGTPLTKKVILYSFPSHTHPLWFTEEHNELISESARQLRLPDVTIVLEGLLKIVRYPMVPNDSVFCQVLPKIVSQLIYQNLYASTFDKKISFCILYLPILHFHFESDSQILPNYIRP